LIVDVLTILADFERHVKCQFIRSCLGETIEILEILNLWCFFSMGSVIYSHIPTTFCQVFICCDNSC